MQTGASGMARKSCPSVSTPISIDAPRFPDTTFTKCERQWIAPLLFTPAVVNLVPLALHPAPWLAAVLAVPGAWP